MKLKLNAKTPEPFEIEQFQTPCLKDNRTAYPLGYVRIFYHHLMTSST